MHYCHFKSRRNTFLILILLVLNSVTTVAIYFGEDEELVRRLKAYNLVSFWTSAEVAVWTQKPEEGNGPKFSHKEAS